MLFLNNSKQGKNKLFKKAAVFSFNKYLLINNALSYLHPYKYDMKCTTNITLYSCFVR